MLKKMNKAQEQALLILLGLTFLAPQAKGSSAGEELRGAIGGSSLGTRTTIKLESLPPSSDKGPIQSAEKTSNPPTLV